MTTTFIPNPPVHQTRSNARILRKRQIAALIGLALLVLLTALLGGWQLWRAEQKSTLIAEIERQQALPELTWSQGIPPTWRLIRLEGQWLPQHEIMLDQRVQDGKVGYHLITPFRLKDGSIVMVNRGWWSPGEQLTPPPAAGAPRISVQPWPRFIELGQTPIQGRIFQNLDTGRFAAWAHLPIPSVYGVAHDAEPGIWPIKTEQAMPVERHLAYALSWFLMSLFGAFLWWKFYCASRYAAQSKV